MKRLHLLVRGRVHAVGFRNFCQERAMQMGLGGWARNIPGMMVEIVAEGPEAKLRELLAAVHEGPPLAEVHQVSYQFAPATYEFDDFLVHADGNRTDARELRALFPRSTSS